MKDIHRYVHTDIATTRPKRPKGRFGEKWPTTFGFGQPPPFSTKISKIVGAQKSSPKLLDRLGIPKIKLHFFSGPSLTTWIGDGHVLIRMSLSGYLHDFWRSTIGMSWHERPTTSQRLLRRLFEQSELIQSAVASKLSRGPLCPLDM